MALYTNNSRLSDGRTIRKFVDRQGTVSKDKEVFNQEDLFRLVAAFRRAPMTEALMTNLDHDDSINRSRVWKAIDANDCWRAREYAVYRKGFENKRDVRLGDTIVYSEEDAGHRIRHAFMVPDARHPTDKDKSLRQATGVAFFDIYKLEYDSLSRTVRVSQDFNPETDVYVVDVVVRDWLLVDAHGIPIKEQTAFGCEPKDSHKRYFMQRASSNMDHEDTTMTGWHGSIIREGVGPSHMWNPCIRGDGNRVVSAADSWNRKAGVALIEMSIRP